MLARRTFVVPMVRMHGLRTVPAVNPCSHKPALLPAVDEVRYLARRAFPDVALWDDWVPVVEKPTIARTEAAVLIPPPALTALNPQNIGKYAEPAPPPPGRS